MLKCIISTCFAGNAGEKCLKDGARGLDSGIATRNVPAHGRPRVPHGSSACARKAVSQLRLHSSVTDPEGSGFFHLLDPDPFFFLRSHKFVRICSFSSKIKVKMQNFFLMFKDLTI